MLGAHYTSFATGPLVPSYATAYTIKLLEKHVRATWKQSNNSAFNRGKRKTTKNLVELACRRAFLMRTDL
jgi:hypothetical protein